MNRKVLGLLVAFLFITSIAFASVAIQKDGVNQGVATTINIVGQGVTTDGSTFNIGVTTENVTTSAANPGVGVASVSTLVTNVTTDDTGASADVITLAAGVAGQVKIITLKSDVETAGLKVTPVVFASATTDVLLEDTGDSVTFVYDGASWVLTSNIGGTLE